MDSWPFDAPLKKGLLNVPGASPESVALLKELLRKDYEEHHCFWSDSGLHNHLSHHLLAAHDLGSPASLLRAIFENEVGMQQPLRKPGSSENPILTVANWTTRLGKSEAYPDYLTFFTSQISDIGVSAVLQHYVFSPSANGNGALMLIRFVGGLMHPFIELGYGVEFGQDFMVAQGLAQAAVTPPGGVSVFDMPAGMPTVEKNSNQPAASLLSLLREAYESPILAPVMPYEPGVLMIKRLRDWMSDPKRGVEIRRIYSKWTIDLDGGDEEIDRKVQECIVQATLLLAATGKPGRKPRVDFFLMHYLTGAIFLPTVLKVLDTTAAKAQLLHSYVRVAALILMLRGRPRINIPLVMSYPMFPQPPRVTATANASTFGKPDDADGSNPWLAVVKNALHHPEPHVAKATRTLYYAAQRYGHTSAGAFSGSFDASGAETHSGSAGLDGTVFIRAAGVMSQAMGWVIAGEDGADWDRSGLGWEEAWASSD